MLDVLCNRHSKGKTDSLTSVSHQVQRKGVEIQQWVYWMIRQNPEANFSSSFSFLLWKEKHCPELPWISHREPKAKLYCPRTHSNISMNQRGQVLELRGQSVRLYIVDNQAFCLIRSHPEVLVLLYCTIILFAEKRGSEPL